MAKYVDIEKEIEEMKAAVEIQKRSGKSNELVDYIFDLFINKFESIPQADVVGVEKAEWMFESASELFGGDIECWSEHGDPIAEIHCSKCGFEPYVGDVCAIPDDAIEAITQYKYCPKCGAYMRGD